MPDFCQMLCFSRKTRKHMQHQTNKRCSRLCGICTKTVAAVPLLSVNRGMNGSVFIWNYIKLKLNIADMEYILHFFNKYVNHFYRLRSILKMSTLNSTFFHVFIVLLFCTICSLFYCIFSLLGSAIVRLPLLPASHAPYFRSYASCFTSSSNSSPAE